MTETVNVAPTPNKFAIGLTLKAGAGFDCEWITPKVYGQTADEAAQNTVDLIKALADKGVVELTSQAANAVRGAYKGTSGGGNASRGGAAVPKTFSNGKVQPKAEAAPDNDTCPHGRTLREGQGAKGPWAAMFCSAREKHEQCDPLWRQKDGSFQ
ncbi:hypothetical protein [Streptomyces sp. PsTaAH-124]|uniref:hypothetical protein n=1 Tax=Streptomyces sp. PsTaAH-124 TaxID=1157638 RepID=UPI000361D90D|nr:hypothetical protein [Streptomyces sp. PsTaAH-124]